MFQVLWAIQLPSQLLDPAILTGKQPKAITTTTTKNTHDYVKIKPYVKTGGGGGAD